ncbi:tyrosine-type recombinase/integrase [Shewanella baltica]|uniref:tyrosine-type recombinase/integrase n=1 Tax=Shewanella baltica TaxID=62322 RepID=UPI000E016B3F|nr:tyrosine-type recombinase/integrase [Shewanella baltica]SUI61577.1 Tyrosine recombinase XerD [Shewanella baltica]
MKQFPLNTVQLTPAEAKGVINQHQIKNIEVHGNSLRAVFKRQNRTYKQTLYVGLTSLEIVSVISKLDGWRKLSPAELELAFANYKRNNTKVPLTINDLIENYTKNHYPTLAPATVKSYKGHFKRISLAIGEKNILEINSNDVFKFRNEQLSTLAWKTVNETIRLLDTLLQNAVDNGDLVKSPINLRRMKIKQGHGDSTITEKLFTIEDLNKIQNSISINPMIALIILFNCCAGLRFSELMGLSWEDIDLEKRIITIRRARVDGKYKTLKVRGVESRQVDILDPALWMLNEMKKRFYELSPQQTIKTLGADYKQIKQENVRFVLLCMDTQTSYQNEQKFRKDFYHFLKVINVSKTKPNHCRHTFTSLACNEGANQTYISKQLGHASVLTAEKHYLKWNKSPNKVERDSASQKINSIFERFTTAQG